MPSKHFLNNITIPSPCSADWNSMTGNDQVRFCEHCSLDVHNLSKMSRVEAQRLVTRSQGRLCVRYYRDPAGQPLVLPVPQKLHRIGRRVSRIAAGAFTATLSVTSAIAQQRLAESPSAGCKLPVATQSSARWGLGGSVVGRITDPNGAVIPGATVSIWNDQNIALYASTGFDGEFRIDGLAAGSYKLRIEASGFAASEINGFYVDGSEEVRMDKSVTLASIEENVDVEGTAEGTEVVAMGGAVAFVAPAHPFVKAAQEDNLETLSSLLAGTDVNLRDPRSHTTALEHAVQNANREMVQFLLSAGASVHTKNAMGQSVLMMLDDDATSDLVWDLINAGTKVNLKDENGNTALMLTAATNNVAAVKALLDAGAKIELKNDQGMAALMFAATGGSVNVIRELILAGADVNASDKEYKNAFSYATENDHKKVVRLLKSKGAVEAVVPETENDEGEEPE